MYYMNNKGKKTNERTSKNPPPPKTKKDRAKQDKGKPVTSVLRV